MNSGMRLVTAPAGRRSKWLVILVWVIIVALAGPLGSKISSVQRNDTVGHLPHGSESAKADREYRAFPQSRQQPALVVYRRDTGLSRADLATVEAHRAKLAGLVSGGIAPATISADRTTAMLRVPVPVPGTRLTYAETSALAKTVRRIQATVGEGGDGLRVAVTGQAGHTTATADIRRFVNMKLLLVTLLLVMAVLIVAYRSPWLWAVALAVGGIGMGTAEAVVYVLAESTGVTLTDLSQGLLTVLALGAYTNYALLLVARYREELHRHSDRHEAMRAAVRRTHAVIFTAGATVIIGSLCLLTAGLGSSRGLGPICAVAVACAMAAATTLLPAVLTVFGRWLFWPLTPRFGRDRSTGSGPWAGIGRAIRRRPRTVWAGAVLLLAVMSAGLPATDTGLGSEDAFTRKPQAVIGQELLVPAFPAGITAPAVIVADTPAAGQVLEAVRGTPGIVQPSIVGTAGGRTLISAPYTASPSSDAALDIMRQLRERVHAVPGADALVGGTSAITADVAATAARDRLVVIPLMLVVLGLLLGLVLRALVAPVLLVAALLLSYCAALGLGTAAFGPVFGFAGQDHTLALHAFVYLAAFAVDYSVFLMIRVRQEAARRGTEAAVPHGLAATGPVVASAGLVLAAAFAAICLLPLVSVVEVGVVVAVGVLLEAFVVRSALVPALTLDVGDRVWWPGTPAPSPEPDAVPAGQARERIPASGEVNG